MCKHWKCGRIWLCYFLYVNHYSGVKRSKHQLQEIGLIFYVEKDGTFLETSPNLAKS